MADQNPHPPELSLSRQMMQLVWPAAAVTQAVCVAGTLGIADLIKDQPRTAEELAAETGSHSPSLQRLLRALAGLGIFAEEDGMFRNTPLSDTLRSDVPGSVRDGAIMMDAPFFWRPWGDLVGPSGPANLHSIAFTASRSLTT